jgi:cell division protein YceG involved in septum cleavage|tara:strand:+ start:961 stop:1266 length:306 start_codon:yes stop_codon:yes gene_type:complete
MSKTENKGEIKKFLIKLIAITTAIIIIINVSYNLIFADKLETLNMIFSLNERENIELIKEKIRKEINSGLEKEDMIADEDKKILFKLYNKLKKEFENFETN